MVLVPEVVDAVAPMPVLAAGGIGRGRQMAAAMALGAQGVWCGSVWLTTEEAETHPAVKEKFLAATSADTVRSRSLTGKPARMLRSRVDRRVGAARRPRSLGDAAAARSWSPRPSAGSAAPPHASGSGAEQAGQLLRRPGRRHHEPSQDARHRSCST